MFDQILKNNTCSNSSNQFDEKHPIKISNHHLRKNEESKATSEWTWNIFVASFSLDVLAFFVFVICKIDLCKRK